jgi:hypothetical protein
MWDRMASKRLIASSFVSLSLSVLGCQSETDHDKGSVDNPKILGNGLNASDGLGGYWFTEVDRSLTTTIEPNTGKVDPLDPNSTTLRSSLRTGYGLEDDGAGNTAFHVTGTVGAAPLEPLTSSFSDEYWNQVYPQLCVDGDCREVLSPKAHLGVGIRVGNQILGELGTGIQGIVFRAKVGENHDGLLQGIPRPIRVTAPMDLTDVPDPSFGDKFGTLYAEGADAALLAISENRNVPFCSFVGSKRFDGNGIVGTEDKTCFCHLQSPEIPLSNQWKTFCIPLASFGDPGCPGLAKATFPEGGITKVIPERLIKILFEAYRPQGNEPATDFDLWVDDILMIAPKNVESTELWDKYCGEGSGATVL